MTTVCGAVAQVPTQFCAEEIVDMAQNTINKTNNLFIIDAKLATNTNKSKKFKNFFHKTLENVEKSCIFA